MFNWSGVTYKIQYKWKKLKQKLHSCRYRVQDLLVLYIPSDQIRDLPKAQALPLGLFAILCCLGVGVYLLAVTYLRLSHNSYLSLENDSSSVCEEVLSNIDDDYYSDMDGYWRGNRNFSYGRSLYVYHAQIKKTFEEYQSGTSSVLNGVVGSIGQFMSEQNLGMNLLMLMTFQTTFNSEGNMAETDTFRFVTTPSDIFNTGVYDAAAGTMESICEVSPTVEFDRANHKFGIIYSYSQFSNSTACMNSFNPTHLGYDAQWSGDTFSISIDVNTLTTVVAVNLRLLPTNSFEKVDLNPQTPDVGQQIYIFTQFQGMEEFYCFLNDGDYDDYTCFLKVGDLFVLPFFNHGGYNSTEPSYCECDDVQWRLSSECNYFHFLSGFLIYDYDEAVETSVASLNRMRELSFHSNMSLYDINRRAYDISYDVTNEISVTHGNRTWRHEHYQFCKSGDGKYCSLLSFYKSSTSSSASSFHFQIFNGSCNDFVSLSPEGKERMMNLPPVELVEPYVKCRRTVFAALSDTLGIVAGNFNAVRPIIVLGVFYIYWYGYIQRKGVKQDVTYSKLELDAISKFLSFNLALARDGIHPSQRRAEEEVAVRGGVEDVEREKQAILNSSLLMQLLEELRQIESIYRFHPPAKSEYSDEEEEEGMKRASTRNQWLTNPMTDRNESPNSMNVEMTGVESRKGEQEAAAAKKKRRRGRKKKTPVRTDPNTMLNPLVFKLKH